MSDKAKYLEGLVLIIPALNESIVIGGVVEACKKIADVIVVDDGSTDETAEIAKRAGAYVVIHEKNQGYEAALETGINIGHQLGYRFGITLDGDGQHSLERMGEIYKKLDSGAEVVCGTRDKTQRFSEDIFSVYGLCLFGVRDPLCGLKGYNLNIPEICKPFNTFKSVGTELLFRVAKRGGGIEQVNIPIIPRVGSSRYGEGFAANLKILNALRKVILMKVKLQSV